MLGRVGHRAADADTTLTHGWSADASAGLDARAHVTNELTLDLALNPDFGQVEADTVVLNLSTYETFFPEKRPFFLEGIDVVRDGAPAGLHAPHRPAAARRRRWRPARRWSRSPSRSPLYGAAKLVGTIGARTTVGLISALTGPNDVEVADVDRRARAAAAGSAGRSFNVLRVKRKLAANAEVGVLATATNRFETPQPIGAATLPGRRERCPGPTAAAPTTPTSSAPTGAGVRASGTTRSRGRRSARTLQNGPPRVEPDGTEHPPGTVRGGRLAIRRQGRRRALAVERLAAPRRADARVQRRRLPGAEERLPGVLDARVPDARRRGGSPRETCDARCRSTCAETLDGLNLWREIGLATSATFDQLLVVYFERPRSRRLLRRSRDRRRHRARARGQRRRLGRGRLRPAAAAAPFWLSSTFDLRRGGGVTSASTRQIALRALSRLELALLPTAGYESGAPRYVSKDACRRRQDPSTYSSARRTRRASARRCARRSPSRPSCRCSGTRSCFSRASTTARFFMVTQPAGGERPPRRPRRRPSQRRSMPDTETATLNVNVVLRWEYRLGSTLFLVYTRAQNPALVPSRDGAAFELRPLLQGRAADNVADAQARLLVRLAQRGASARDAARLARNCGRATAKPPHGRAGAAAGARAIAGFAARVTLAPGLQSHLASHSRPNQQTGGFT